MASRRASLQPAGLSSSKKKGEDVSIHGKVQYDPEETFSTKTRRKEVNELRTLEHEKDPDRTSVEARDLMTRIQHGSRDKRYAQMQGMLEQAGIKDKRGLGAKQKFDRGVRDLSWGWESGDEEVCSDALGPCGSLSYHGTVDILGVRD